MQTILDKHLFKVYFDYFVWLTSHSEEGVYNLCSSQPADGDLNVLVSLFRKLVPNLYELFLLVPHTKEDIWKNVSN